MYYWFILIVSGLLELSFTFCMGKFSHATGSPKFLWLTALVCSMALSLYAITKALKGIPIGTAYPIWTGIGAVGTVLIGIFFFKEPVSFGRLFFISTLIVSIIGLKVVSA